MPSKRPQIVGGAVADNFVLIPRPDALRLACVRYAISSSATWGEFRAKMPPDEWQELMETLQEWGRTTLEEYRSGEGFETDQDALQSYLALDFYDRMPVDSDKFDVEQLPGFCDGDWPKWPAQEALRWVPCSIRERFGNVTSSVLNGDFLSLDPSKGSEIIDAMRQYGYRCEHDSLLVNLASGNDSATKFRKYAQRLLKRNLENDAQCLLAVILKDSRSPEEESLEDYAPNNVRHDELLICSTCFGIYGVWSYQNAKGTQYYQKCDCGKNAVSAEKPQLQPLPHVHIQLCSCCGFESFPTSRKPPIICGVCREGIECLEDAEREKIPARQGFEEWDESVAVRLQDYGRKRVAENCNRWGIGTDSPIPFPLYIRTLFENRVEVFNDALRGFCNLFGANPD